MLTLVVKLTETPKNTHILRGLGFDVDEAFPTLRPGMSEFVLSNGYFSFADLIEYLLETTGPAWLDVATWVASGEALGQIEHLISSRQIHRARFLIDPIATRAARKDRKILETINKIGGDVRLLKNHCKFAVLYNHNWNFIVETSANLNKNLRVESWRVSESATYAGFFRRLVDFVFENFPAGVECPLNAIEDYLK